MTTYISDLRNHNKTCIIETFTILSKPITIGK